MLLSDLLEHLTFGELSQLAITNNGTQIKPQDYPKIASHINLALTALFTRFNLRQEEVIVQQYDGITDYYIRKEYAINGGSAQPIKYIVDTAGNPFVDNLVKIEEVYDENGDEVVLNDNNDEASYYIPSFDILQIPTPVATNATSVIYRAQHDKLIIRPDTDITTVSVDIPPYLITPIGLFIASNLITVMTSEDEVIGNNYLAKYEASVKQISDQGMVGSEIEKDVRFDAGGWV